MPSYIEKTGSRTECLSIDSEQVISELSKGKFAISTDANTYSLEQLTFNYIKGLFNVLKRIERVWKECKNNAGNYIKNFEDIPEAEHVIDDTNEYLDVSETLGLGKITATNLNIRADANTNSSVVGLYKNGDEVEVLGYSQDGKWIKVKTPDGKDGYISNKYVEINKEKSINKEIIVNLDQKENKNSIKIEKSNQDVVEKKLNESSKMENLSKKDKIIVSSNLNEMSDSNSNANITGLDRNGDKNKFDDNSINQISNDNNIEKDHLSLNSNKQKAIINTSNSNLNFCSAPSLKSSIYGSIPRGTSVEVVNYNDNSNWVEINYNGQTGYVYKDFIKLEGDKK